MRTQDYYKHNNGLTSTTNLSLIFRQVHLQAMRSDDFFIMLKCAVMTRSRGRLLKARSDCIARKALLLSLTIFSDMQSEPRFSVDCESF